MSYVLYGYPSPFKEILRGFNFWQTFWFSGASGLGTGHKGLNNAPIYIEWTKIFSMPLLSVSATL